MRKSEHFLAFLLISIVLISGCIDGTIKQNATVNNTEISVMETISVVQPTDTKIEVSPTPTQISIERNTPVDIEGRAMKDGNDYYVLLGVGNPGDKPIAFDFMEYYFFIGSFENRIGSFSFHKNSEGTILSRKALYYNFSTSGNLDDMKKIALRYSDNTAKFYVRMMNGNKTFGKKAYMAYLPPVEELPDKSKGAELGYILAFLPVEKQNTGTQIDSLYAEALLYLPPNLSVAEPRSNEDRDYLVMVKLENHGQNTIVFDKVTTLLEEGGDGIRGIVTPKSGEYWKLITGEPLHLVLSTNGHTRQAQQTAKDNKKEKMYFSFKLSYKEKSLYKVFITPLSYMKDLPDSDRILAIDGLPLKLDTFDIPNKTS